MSYLILFALLILVPSLSLVIGSVIRSYRENPGQFQFYICALALSMGYGVWFRIEPVVGWVRRQCKKVTRA